jgi:hypothetical protein
LRMMIMTRTWLNTKTSEELNFRKAFYWAMVNAGTENDRMSADELVNDFRRDVSIKEDPVEWRHIVPFLPWYIDDLDAKVSGEVELERFVQ